MASGGAAYWLVLYGLFSLLSYRTQDHQPRVAHPTMREGRECGSVSRVVSLLVLSVYGVFFVRQASVSLAFLKLII